MITTERFIGAWLPQLTEMVNRHLEALVPGWTVSASYLWGRLDRDPDEYVVDPWVAARTTICAVERDRLVAAAHLQRYGLGPEVSESYQGIGDIGWFVFWPGHDEAAGVLLEAVHGQMLEWAVREEWASVSKFALPLLNGLPDAWPHVRAAISAAGFYRYRPREESIFGGWLARVPLPGVPPLGQLEVRRRVRTFGISFTAVIGDQEIGWCDCIGDLTKGGDLPSLHGWAQLGDLMVAEAWRGRGIGSWIVQHAARWLWMGGCNRIALSVDAESEAAGAGRFYERFGWERLSRFQIGWMR